MRKRSRIHFVSVGAVFITLGMGIAAATPAQAAWSAPVNPPAGCGSQSGGVIPALALNASGAWVIASFVQNSDGTFSVQACTSSDGVNWSTPVTVGQGISPAVALAPNGRAVAIWQGGPSVSPNISASVRPPGGSWSAPVVVSTVPGHPVIQMDGSGNAIAAWASTSLNSPVATASLAANSTTWTAVQTLNAKGGAIGLATNSGGEAIVGFRTHEPSQILVASGTILGGLGTPVDMGPTYGGNFTPGPQIALNDAGVASMAWFNNDFAKVVLRAANGTWGTATQLGGSGSAGACTGIDSAGNAVAAFVLTTQTGNPTYGSLHPSGGGWGSSTLLSALNDQGKVACGGDPAGTFVVNWTDSAGTVQALTIPPGGGFGPGTAVGAGPFMLLKVIPAKAVLWIGAGISKETVN